MLDEIAWHTEIVYWANHDTNILKPPPTQKTATTKIKIKSQNFVPCYKEVGYNKTLL